METFECQICLQRFEDPVECLNCNNNICKKHAINIINGCPICRCFPFNYRDNIWLKRTLLNLDSLFRCILCKYEGDKNSFWSHLINNHKDEIISKYNENNKPKKTKKKDKINNINQDNNTTKENLEEINNINKDEKEQNVQNEENGQKTYPIFNSLNYKTCSNNNNSKLGLNAGLTPFMEIGSQNTNKDDNVIDNNNVRINTQRNYPSSEPKVFTNKPPSTERKVLLYCGKKNELINCKCCPDHICKMGNCLCVNCMRKNIRKLNLKNEELINKEGKIATYYKGSYYCYSQYESIIENVLGRQFKKLSYCQYPSESCNYCKVLNKYKDLYYQK